MIGSNGGGGSDAASGQPTLLTNARMADGRVVDIEVAEGRIAAIRPHEPTRPRPAAAPDADARTDAGDQDLGGWLLLPAMAEPHAHLDKALTADLVPNPAGDLGGAIDAWVAASRAGRITHAGMVERAIAAMDRLVVHGVTAVRSHVNVVESLGAGAARAVLEAAEHFAGVLDVQVVALLGSPVTGPEGVGVRAALAEALQAGVQVVGGCPHLDPDPIGLIDLTLNAASEAGVAIDLHVDEMLDPSVLTLRDYARRVIETGFGRLRAASHCVTLGMQSSRVQAEVAQLVAEAEMAVFPLPQTNLFLQGRGDATATPRGLTAVAALQQAGALVAAGADNVQDPFNLVGRSDPLETAALMVMAGHQLPEVAYGMVSNDARRAMGLEPVRFEVGDPADFVAIDAPTVRGAIADAPMSRRVFRQGRLVAWCDQATRVAR